MTHQHTNFRIPLFTLAALALTFTVHAEQKKDNSINAVTKSDIEVIKVTARRRQEALLDVPLSVSAFSGDVMSTGRTNSLEDLAEATPNVVFNPQAGPITIRGIGSLGINGGLERQMGVGIFLDDVYIRRPNSFPIFLDDLERAEIIRGSQSTLYGENTIGGAINLISRKPGDTFTGSAELSYGNLNYQRLRVGVDVPLSHNFTSRSFITYTKRDGYIENATTGINQGTIDNVGGRFTLFGALSDNTALSFVVDYDRISDDAGTPYAPIALALDGRSENDYPSERQIHRGGVTARIEHDFGSMSLASITSYREYDFLAKLDGDFSPGAYIFQDQDEDQHQFSQEFRLANDPSDTLSWRMGLYYMHEDFSGSQGYDYLGLPAGEESRNTLVQRSNVFAIYGESSYQLTAQIQATFGLRYTRETRDGEAEVTSASGNFFLGAPALVSNKATFSKLLPEFSLSYALSNDTRLYGRVSRGFKAGGVSQFIDVDDSANIFKPETAWSYEIGAKTISRDNQVRFNVALFAIDWTDQQVRLSITPTVRVIRNAADSSSYGGEAELTLQPFDHLEFALGYGYLKAEYDTFSVPFLNADYSGVEQQYAPKHTVSSSVKWEQPIADRLNLFATASFNYRDDYRFEPVSDYRQKSTGMLDSEIGIRMDEYSVSIWGKNITDEPFLKGFVDFGAGQYYGVAGEGRTWGASIKGIF